MSSVLVVEGMVAVQQKINEAGRLTVGLLSAGKSVEIIIREMTNDKPRNNNQNSLVYHLYSRIGVTLYGGDEILARNECKLMIGCRILYRDSEDFRQVFDKVIRHLPHSVKHEAMELISVSSIMTKKQCAEYITSIINQYTLRGVYFADIGGVNEYMKFPELQREQNK